MDPRVPSTLPQSLLLLSPESKTLHHEHLTDKGSCDVTTLPLLHLAKLTAVH